jgi:toxin ParE1/3/4
MGIYTVSPRAHRDLSDIWDFTAAQWGSDQAELYIRDIQRVFELIADQPQLARSCDEIRPGYFRFPAGSHIVFFRRSVDGIAVVRVLHARMDHERQL